MRAAVPAGRISPRIHPDRSDVFRPPIRTHHRCFASRCPSPAGWRQ
ncbi:hypothetical protein [Amycolatopsis plumensis]